MKRAIAILLLFVCAGLSEAGVHGTGGPATTNNDDSCDIALLPAATLLLPYFEVDLSAASGQGETTLLTITNVTNEEQIAAITLWTDYSFPVITLPVYLTGYDTQSINLYDILQNGSLAPPRGTGPATSPQGQFSVDNPDLDIDACFNLPGSIHPAYVTRMKSAFTSGVLPALGNAPACHAIGSVHTRASGYATVDVVGSCALQSPAAVYPGQLRFDNVLVGDYQQVHGLQGSAQGGPLVHIRAVPEGDGASPVNLSRTFYGTLMPEANRTYDRRQPLPSVFAAHWIGGGGPGSFSTDLKIWREGATGIGANCSDYPHNSDIPLAELVMFDEEENGIGYTRYTGICDPGPCPDPRLGAGRYPLDDELPLPHNGANAGWIYLNLDNPDRPGAQQAWVIASMRAENRYSVDVDALALGNGCSPTESVSVISGDASEHFIGPLPNVNP